MMRNSNVIGAHAICMRDSQILMTRRANTSFENGCYGLPGGHVERGESFLTACVREAREEVGIVINPADCVLKNIVHKRYDDGERVEVFFLTHKWEGEPYNAEEERCDDVAWFEIAALPENTIPFIKTALINMHKDQVYSEVGWSQYNENMLDITEKKNYKDLGLPQGLYCGELFAEADGGDAGTFDVYAGLREKYVDQLRAYSLDQSDIALQENTTDYERYGIGNYEERFEKKVRYVIALVHRETDTLASILWYGPRPLPSDVVLDSAYLEIPSTQWDTVAMRTYGNFRGKGITTAFNLFALAKYRQQFPDRSLWLGVQKSNAAGNRLYEKIGFVTQGDDVIDAENVMILGDKSN